MLQAATQRPAAQPKPSLPTRSLCCAVTGGGLAGGGAPDRRQRRARDFVRGLIGPAVEGWADWPPTSGWQPLFCRKREERCVYSMCLQAGACLRVFGAGVVKQWSEVARRTNMSSRRARGVGSAVPRRGAADAQAGGGRMAACCVPTLPYKSSAAVCTGAVGGRTGDSRVEKSETFQTPFLFL